MELTGLFNFHSVVHALKVTSFYAGELASGIYIAAGTQMVYDLIVAVLLADGLDAGYEEGVHILELLGLRNGYDALEHDGTVIPSGVVVGVGVVLGLGLGRLVAMGGCAVALEFLHAGGCGLDDDEIGLAVYLISFMIHVGPFNILGDVVHEKLIQHDFRDGFKKIKSLVNGICENFVIEVP